MDAVVRLKSPRDLALFYCDLLESIFEHGLKQSALEAYARLRERPFRKKRLHEAGNGEVANEAGSGEVVSEAGGWARSRTRRAHEVKLNLSLLEGIHDDMDFCIKLAKEQNVIILPGCAVGLKNWLRITFAVEQSSLEEGLERLKSFCLEHSSQIARE